MIGTGWVRAGKGRNGIDPGRVNATQAWSGSIWASSELVEIGPSRVEARQRWSS